MSNQLEKFIAYNNIKESLIIFDTNALLNLYYIDDYKFLRKYMELITNFCWTPYQVYDEFTRNRKLRIKEIMSNISKLINFENSIKKDIAKGLKACEEIQSSYGKVIRYEVLNRLDCIDEYIKTINNDLHGEMKRMKTLCYQPKDVYNQLIEDYIFLNKGNAYTEEEVLELKDEIKDTTKIYPGYLDQSKENNKYGDYIIWKQIQSKAIESKKDILFITYDIKEQVKYGTYKIDLKKEFNVITGQRFQILNLDELAEITTVKGLNLKSCIAQLHSLEGLEITRLKRWPKKYEYYSYLNNTVFTRRKELIHRREDSIAYEELVYLRKIIEYFFPNILCGSISTYVCALSLDISYTNYKIVDCLCRVVYKANNCFIVFIDIEDATYDINLDTRTEKTLVLRNDNMRKIIDFIIDQLNEKGNDSIRGCDSSEIPIESIYQEINQRV